VYPCANQERSQIFASLAHDFTARVAWYLSGGYTMGTYKGDQAIEAGLPDGDEDSVQVSTRITYKINRSNWLEIGYQYVDFTSDLRVEYDRNRFDLGWKVQL
jgi:hypothetical protein